MELRVHQKICDGSGCLQYRSPNHFIADGVK
jgi:hypothetical protein